MSSHNFILATNEKGEKITLTQVQEWLKNGEKEKLAKLFYLRFYNRFLKSFEYETKDYKEKYKHGFAIMACSCLLIETFISYTNPTFKDNNNKGAKSFGYFFLKYSDFNVFSKRGLTIEEYQSSREIKNKGIPNDFYRNVRCGLLHNGETRNKWKIKRSGDLFNEQEKSINATRFMTCLKAVIKGFENELKSADFENDDIWITYKKRLEFLIQKSLLNE